MTASEAQDRAGCLTRRVDLLGWPVEHSVSPPMHNVAFAALGLGLAYSLLPTPHGRVGPALAGLKNTGFRGGKVNGPHKQAALLYLDKIAADARAIGAGRRYYRFAPIGPSMVWCTIRRRRAWRPGPAQQGHLRSAVLAFELWTGQDAPIGAMLMAAWEALLHRPLERERKPCSDT